MCRGNLSLLLQRKRKKERKRGLDMKALGPDEKVFQRSARMKSYLIQKVCKYPLNPDVLITSNCRRWRGGTMCLHSTSVQVFLHEDQEWTVRMIPQCGSFVQLHQSRNSGGLFSFRVRQLKTNIWLKQEPEGHKPAVLFFFSKAFLHLFLSKQLCLFMLLSFQPSHWYPPSQMCHKTQTHATSRAGFWV